MMYEKKMLIASLMASLMVLSLVALSGCDLLDKAMEMDGVMCQETHLEDASRSELFQEMIDRGLGGLWSDDD